MSNVNADATQLLTILKNMRTSISSIETTRSSVKMKYQQLGIGWNDNIITLNDENGNEVEFEFLDLIPYRQNEYVVLLPIGDSDGQVVILQLKEIDDETEEYVGVENEFVLETVFALFKERNKDFFTFE